MSNTTTIARPYAKAIFERAMDTDSFDEWSEILTVLTTLVMEKEVMAFIKNPSTIEEQQMNLLIAPFEKLDLSEMKAMHNLLHLLILNKRLMSLPDIKDLYEAFRAEKEKTLEVSIRSFSILSSEQKEKFKNSLSQRLNRKIVLNVSVDKSLLGGAVIQAGDLVIDGSVREQLNKLGARLVA